MKLPAKPLISDAAKNTCFAVALTLAGCAGRAPEPVAVVQPQDRYTDCPAIEAEIQANNKTVQGLASEEGAKVAQNVAAGVAGLFIWPLWFAMDLQGSASKEEAALQSRQQYLAALAAQRGCAGSVPMVAAGRPAPALSAPRAPVAPGTLASAPTASLTGPEIPANPTSTPPVIAAPAAGGRVVLFPVMIFNRYQPHWMVDVN